MAEVDTAQNRFPPATAVGTRTRVVYDLLSPAGIAVSINFTDRAGEEIDRLTEETIHELGDNDGILLLLDSMQHRQDLQTGLRRMLNMIHMASGRDATLSSTPVAICLTKVDRLLLSHHELHEAEDAPDVFVSTRIDSSLDAVAKTRLRRFRFFPVSAAGVFVSHDCVRTATFYDESLTLRLAHGGSPVNLTKPIEWLIETMESPLP